MKNGFKIFAGLAIVLAILFSACSNNPKETKDKETVKMESEKGEHARDVGEKGEGEEDGTQFGKDDVYDVLRNGAHLILSYDAESNAFVGTVENVTDEMIEKVRVEVHLSNGTELGPTKPMDLKPGEKVTVELKATEKAFETWSSHAEVGNSEHGEEGEGEHAKEGKGEHGGEGEGEHSGEKEGEHK